MSGLYAQDLLGARPIFLLTLTAAGRVWRLASETVEVLDDNGASHLYQGQLDAPSVAESLGSLGDAPTEPGVALDGLVLDGALDLLAEGHDLAAGRGELAVWLEGTTLEARHVLVSGRITGPVAGLGDVVSLALGDRLGDDRGRLLAVGAVVDATTWPNAASNAIGNPYPVVLGAPGVYTSSAGATTNTTGSPCLVVDNTGGAEVLLICDGWVGATTIRIFNTDDRTSETFSVVLTTDGNGRRVSTVSFAAAASITVDAETEYAAWWNGGGGLVGDRGEVIDGLGDAIVWALRKSTLPIDLQGWESVRQALNVVTIGGYIDQDTTPIGWVLDTLLPLAPVSLRFGPDGLAPVLWRLDVLAGDVEAVLDLDTLAGDLALDSDGISSAGDYVSEFRLTYARRQHRGDYKRTRTLTGRDLTTAEAATPNVIQQTAHLRSAYLAAVASTGSTQPVTDELTTDWVYDEASAGYVLGWRARLKAHPVQSITLAATWDLGWLRVGGAYLLRYPDLLRVDRIAQLEAVELSLDGPRYTFRLLRDVARDLFTAV